MDIQQDLYDQEGIQCKSSMPLQSKVRGLSAFREELVNLKLNKCFLTIKLFGQKLKTVQKVLLILRLNSLKAH